MWRNVKVKTKPTLDPVSLAELKARIRVDSSDDDTVISAYLRGAVARIDGPAGIGYALMSQTWEYTLDAFPSVIYLPGAPVVSVTSIKYYDVDNVLQTLDSADYRLDIGTDCARIESVDSWPGIYTRFGAVIVEYVLGVADSVDLPADLVDAVCLMVAHRCEERQITGMPQTATPFGYESIINEYKRLSAA